MRGKPRPATSRTPSTPTAAIASTEARPKVRSSAAASAAPAPPAFATARVVREDGRVVGPERERAEGGEADEREPAALVQDDPAQAGCVAASPGQP